MQLPKTLYCGTLIKRYKRFLADICLERGENITAHCPNPGRMTGLSNPGSRVWVSCSPNPNRKLPFTLELIEADGGLVGVNTHHPNKIVREAIEAHKIAQLKGYDSLRTEVKYAERSRVDILLEDEKIGRCWVEVKNVHLRRDSWESNGTAEFPDSVTVRGSKHIEDLVDQIKIGDKSVLIFLIQRMDCKDFKIARDIDPVYYETLLRGMENGLEVLCFDTNITLSSISLRNSITFCTT
tara:strand:+ start:1368 stop:2084 length:717 start_codon:yes stop_codon:yes gene_type:complete